MPASRQKPPSQAGIASLAAKEAAAPPAVTPELRSWIVAQAQAGHSAPAILQSMQDSGWQEDIAIEALEDTLRAHLEAQARAKGLPLSVPVPDFQLDNDPTVLDAGDCKVRVLMTLAQPRIVILGGVLSDDECDALIAASKPRMQRSLTVITQTGGEEVNADRTSEGMFFQRGETELIQRIETRIAHLLNWPIEHGEGLQVLHYQPGAQYKPHYDYFEPNEAGTPALLERGGQRVGTLLLYLNTPEQGGSTTFPDIHLEVSAQRGNAVFFSYERPHPSTRTLHGGAPVIKGSKWIATKWLRERCFD
jgi:prolyl 4-hydroxylase